MTKIEKKLLENQRTIMMALHTMTEKENTNYGIHLMRVELYRATRTTDDLLRDSALNSTF